MHSDNLCPDKSMVLLMILIYNTRGAKDCRCFERINSITAMWSLYNLYYKLSWRSPSDTWPSNLSSTIIGEDWLQRFTKENIACLIVLSNLTRIQEQLNNKNGSTNNLNSRSKLQRTPHTERAYYVYTVTFLFIILCVYLLMLFSIFQKWFAILNGI